MHQEHVEKQSCPDYGDTETDLAKGAQGTISFFKETSLCSKEHLHYPPLSDRPHHLSVPSLPSGPTSWGPSL